MNDLEWLARNVHEWPTLDNGVECEMIYRHDAISTGWGRHWPTDREDGSEVTRDQWLAERARLQNKPKWEEFPQAKIRVQNGNGIWCVGTYELARVEDQQWSGNGEGYWITLTHTSKHRGEVLGDWRDTLEHRPEYSLYEVTTSNSDKYMLTDAPEPKKEWRGPEDGLPPVGEECEVYRNGEWELCEIIAHIEQPMGTIAVFSYGREPGYGISGVDCLIPRYFRPVDVSRAEEDRAVEDMINIIAEAFSKSGGEWADNEDIARAIYAAGYRKQEPSE